MYSFSKRLKQKTTSTTSATPPSATATTPQVTNERRTNRWANNNENSNTTGPSVQTTYKSNANLNLATTPTTPPLSPSSLVPQNKPTSPIITSPVANKLLNTRGNQRWETTSTPPKTNQNTSANILGT